MKVTIREVKNPKNKKLMTEISGITHNPQVIDKLEKKLKSACGAGGYIDKKIIYIQGSHSSAIEKILIKEGYKVTVK